jgi:hypothetical protein
LTHSFYRGNITCIEKLYTCREPSLRLFRDHKITRAILLFAGLFSITATVYGIDLISGESYPRNSALYHRPAFLTTTAWLADQDGVLMPGETAHVCLLVENLSSGKAYGVTGYISGTIPAGLNVEQRAVAEVFGPSDRRILMFRVETTESLVAGHHPLMLTLTERYTGIHACMDIRLACASDAADPVEPTSFKSKPDRFTLPGTIAVPHNPDDIALIIANEDYRHFPPDGTVDAFRDGDLAAETFRARGIPEERIITIKNATSGVLQSITGDETMPGILDGRIVPGSSACFIHFTGRGWTDPETGADILLPVDARTDPESLRERGQPLNALLQEIAEYGPRSISVVLDTSFPGADMVATTGGSEESPVPGIPERTAVLIASSHGERAIRFRETGYGLFTYLCARAVTGALRDGTALTAGDLFTLLTDSEQGVPGMCRSVYGGAPQHPRLLGDRSLPVWEGY